MAVDSLRRVLGMRLAMHHEVELAERRRELLAEAAEEQQRPDEERDGAASTITRPRAAPRRSAGS